ncbi:MAG: CobW family GTP-binding protein [Pikeienuella sp.]
MSRIPITILTGFLGAGKTTFLNRLIADPAFQNTAVVINEFGEAGVDGALVAQSDERAFAMSVGCLCCTVSGDVRLTLLRLQDEAERGVGPVFDRVVIETTGLADPLPLLQAFMTNDFLLSKFTLNGVITVVDAVNGEHCITHFPEAQRQVAVADLLLLTKTELAEEGAAHGELDRLKGVLSNRNPNARLFRAEDVTPEQVFSLAAFDPAGQPPDVSEWLRFEPSKSNGTDHHHHHDVNNHGDTASAFCFTAKDPIKPTALESAIRSLLISTGSNLLRMKGLVELIGYPDAPCVVHVVGHVISPMKLLGEWPEGIDQTRLVLIISGENRKDAPQQLSQALPQLQPFNA